MIYYFLAGLIVLVAGLAWGLWVIFSKLRISRLNQQATTASYTALLENYRPVGDLEEYRAKLSTDIASLQGEINDAVNTQNQLSNQAETIRQQLALYNGEQTVVVGSRWDCNCH